MRLRVARVGIGDSVFHAATSERTLAIQSALVVSVSTIAVVFPIAQAVEFGALPSQAERSNAAASYQPRTDSLQLSPM